MSFFKGLANKLMGGAAKKMPGAIEAASQKSYDRLALKAGKKYVDIGHAPSTNFAGGLPGTQAPGDHRAAVASRLAKMKTP